jgi:hypothetical protein
MPSLSWPAFRTRHDAVRRLGKQFGGQADRCRTVLAINSLSCSRPAGWGPFVYDDEPTDLAYPASGVLSSGPRHSDQHSPTPIPRSSR